MDNGLKGYCARMTYVSWATRGALLSSLLLAACGGSTNEGTKQTTTQGGSAANGGSGNQGGSAAQSSSNGGKSTSAGGSAASGTGSTPQGGASTSVPGAGGNSTVGGSGAGGAGAAAAQEPVDTRPARPVWTPPFTSPLGTTGWQQSTEPICEKLDGISSAFDVWADERGVYAMFLAGCNVFAGVSCGKDGATIKYNPGSGWQVVYQFASGTVASAGRTLWGGFQDGPLLVTAESDAKLGAYFVEKGSLTLQRELTSPGGAFVVGKDLAYVLDDMKVLQYSAGTWTTVGEAKSRLLAVWADSQNVVVAGEDQTIMMRSGTGALTAIPAVPAGTYGSVWAFGPKDIWAGNTAGQLVHYNGTAWETIQTGSRDISGSGIKQLWGANGTLYFITFAEFGRWNGSKIEMLLEPPAGTDLSTYPGQFGGIWGRSANEVFIALRDTKYAKYACGSAFMLWFDGTAFHQF